MVGASHVSLAATHDITRAADGYFNNTAGRWSLFEPNIARRTNRGLLVEAGQEYQPTNSSLEGAVIGVVDSGGELPTDWSKQGLLNGSTTVDEIFEINNLPAIKITFDVSNTSGETIYPNIRFCSVPTSVGETWTGSIVYDQTSNVGDGSVISSLALQERQGSTYLPPSPVTLGLTAGNTQQTITGTTAQATVDNVWLLLTHVLPAGQSLKRTMTFSAHQLTKTDHVLSPIITTNTGTVFRPSDQIHANTIATTLATMTRGIIKVHLHFDNIYDGGSYPRLLGISNAAGTEAVEITSSPSGELSFILRTSNVDQFVNPQPNQMLVGDNILVLGLFENGDVYISLNGSTAEYSSATIPNFSNFTTAYIGATRNGDIQLASILTQITVLDEDPTNARLETLSTL